ncbi:hypothetical protein [Embleya sp. NBC_00896]|uniref:hypothetical protein n=1 Tax=Embleya sp. NBC_00896 TaxID=2975961 RepID=UPI002F919357|nr:hypothetical protein OG928_41700 [Embleya sp. NBC_00896]
MAGRVPHDVLVERALRAVVADKLLRLWAVRAGLLADPSEQAFRARLDAENARRAAAAAGVRPEPGVPRYEEESYARTELAGLSAALRESLADRVDLSDARLRARHGELLAAAGPSNDAPPFEQVRDQVRGELLAGAFDRELADRVAAARVEPLPVAAVVVRQAE